jgi:hypothetical protein
VHAVHGHLPALVEEVAEPHAAARAHALRAARVRVADDVAARGDDASRKIDVFRAAPLEVQVEVGHRDRARDVAGFVVLAVAAVHLRRAVIRGAARDGTLAWRRRRRRVPRPSAGRRRRLRPRWRGPGPRAAPRA